MLFQTTKSIISKIGATKELGSLFKKLSLKNVLIVTDEGVIKFNLMKDALESLQNDGINVTIYDGVRPDPPEYLIQEVAQMAKDNEVDSIIGFGGGSPMDIAKLVAYLSSEQNHNIDISEIYGVDNCKGTSRLPLIQIPTTAGTGSEVTPISIITTGENEKKGVVSDLLYPDYAILDASLTTSLPTFISASTGIDAMVHAIEAQTSVHKKNSLSDMLSREALNLLGKNIYRVCENGDDLEARQNMLLGSMLAGQAFANAPVAAVHALAYPIGTHFKVSHGVSNVLMLPHVLRFNARNAWASDIYDSIVPLCFPDLQDTNANFHDEGADIMSTRFLQMTKDFEIPGRLKDVNIEYSDCEMLATEAMKQTRLLPNNPRLVEFDDAFNLYVDAL